MHAVSDNGSLVGDGGGLVGGGRGLGRGLRLVRVRRHQRAAGRRHIRHLCAAAAR